jgi:GT2 family glycosyltransferase/SAM-dependent methyltransferase
MPFELLPPSDSPDAASLLRPRDALLRGLDYDQLQRYLLVGRLLDRMLRELPRPVRLLEVGSNVLDILPLLFADGAVRGHRCDVQPAGTGPDFTLIERGKPLPFADGAFDAVVALEVLEHVPAADRRAFLAECLRVARHGAVFTCPNGTPEVVEHEALAAAAYRYRNDQVHPFLCEHEEFGLPRPDEVQAILHDLGCPHAVFDNSPLDRWLAMIVLSETIAETSHQPADLRGLLNDVLFPDPVQPAVGGYRKVYVCARTPLARAALEPLPRAPLPAALPLSGPVASLQALASLTTCALTHLMGEHRAAVARTERCRHAIQRLRHRLGLARAALWRGEEELWQRQTALEAVTGKLDETERDRQALWERGKMLELQLRGTFRTRFVKLARLLRLARELIRPHAYDARTLEAIRALDRVAGTPPDTWESTDANPVFLLHVQALPGPVYLRLRIRSEVAGTACLHIDAGKGLVLLERFAVEPGPEATGPEGWYYFPRGVRTLRLQPLDRPGRFRIEDFRLEPASVARRLGHALGGTARPVPRRAPSSMHPAVVPARPSAYAPPDAYARWCRLRRLTARDRARLRAAAAAMPDPPRISVLLPVYNTPDRLLRAAIQSVLRQTYPHWELCVADDSSTAEHVRPLLEEYSRRDPRVRVTYRDTNGNISAASNTALEMARGEYVALLDHDDELAEHALSRVAEAIIADRSLDMIYSDEDKLEMDGSRNGPMFKPDWSPEFFLACMYTCHLGVYRTALVRQLGSFRSEFDSAQDYDLVLRIVARTSRIHHIPDVLYHYRRSPTSTARSIDAKPQAPDAARRALEYHLAETGRPGRVEPGPIPCTFRVRYHIRGNPRLSIVIPSACRPLPGAAAGGWYVTRCVESIRRRSTYGNYEILVVDGGAIDPRLARELDRAGVRRLTYDGPVNLAAKMNRGARACAGEHLLFLNDDTEVITPDWLESLLEFSQEEDIGAVGAKLLFPDGRVQHAGTAVLGGNPTHPLMLWPGDAWGPMGSLVLHRNWSAVTGACLMTRRAAFGQVAGFDERFAVCYNDVDYCLRLQRLGLRVVYQPAARLYHHESASRAGGVAAAELRLFHQVWGRAWARDPYYNPNLSVDDNNWRIDLRPPAPARRRRRRQASPAGGPPGS